MGVAREGAITAKIQWDDGDTSARYIIENLDIIIA